MAKTQSKRYKAALEMAEEGKQFTLPEAIALIAQMPGAKFNETVEISAKMGVDPKQGDQMVRGMVNLPHGSGKEIRVVVFTENPEAALAAGAEHAGLDDMLKKIEDGWMDFDVAISTPSAMKEVRKVARVLGPRGLMPNPKSGTVTDDIEAGVKAVKAGRVEFKMDKTANMAVIIGKRSFSSDQLVENAEKAIDAIGSAKPESFKGGQYVKSMTVSSSMSPGVRLNVKEFKQL